MKNAPVKIKVVRKVANVYVLRFPKLDISLTVNEYFYQKMRRNTDQYEFETPQVA